MFKKFTQAEQVSGSTQVKSSVARAIKSKAIEMMPPLEVSAAVTTSSLQCGASVVC